MQTISLLGSSTPAAVSWKLFFAGAMALTYAVIAISIVHGERTASGGGNFITLRGMGAWLATAPVSLPLELLGHKIDFRSNWQMGAAISLCAALIFGLSYALAKGAEFLAQLLVSH